MGPKGHLTLTMAKPARQSCATTCRAKMAESACPHAPAAAATWEKRATHSPACDACTKAQRLVVVEGGGGGGIRCVRLRPGAKPKPPHLSQAVAAA